MRQAITTRYMGPTNTHGSRIKATARKRSSMGGEISHSEPYQYRGTEQEHCACAKALAEKLEWSGLWVGGGNVEENGYVYVCIGFPKLEQDIVALTDSIGLNGADWFLIAKKEG